MLSAIQFHCDARFGAGQINFQRSETNTIAGRTQYGNTELSAELAPLTITDDRSMFRLSQLAPGTYVVVVPSTQTTVPAASVAGSIGKFGKLINTRLVTSEYSVCRLPTQRPLRNTAAKAIA